MRLRSTLPLGVLALAVLWTTAAVPRARAEDGPCAAQVEHALEFVRDAEKTNNVASAQKAVELLLAAEKACPDDALIPFWRGIAQVFARNYPGAIEGLSRVRRILTERAAMQNRPAAEVDSNSLVLFLEGAIHQYLGGRPDLTLEKLNVLKARDPRFMPDRVSLLKYFAHVGWGSILARKNELIEAIKQTKLGVAEAQRQMLLVPGNPGAIQRRDMANRNLAGIYRLSDRWVEAQQVYEELAKLYPKDAAIHYGLASVYADQTMFTRAAETWKATVSLIESGGVTDPRDLVTVEDAKMRYGVSLVMAQKVAEGKTVLVAYADAHPDDGRVFQYLGWFAMDMWEDFDKSQEWLERSRRLDPWCEDTLRHMVKLYTIHKPDPVRLAEVEKTLGDPELVKARKAEMERRKRVRPDATNGCR